ncbi:MAG: beta-ketoacyl-[acyl-carrier-protein] synthase family protein [Rhodospirillales bacterium]
MSLAALRSGRSGLRACDFGDADIPTWIGRVDGVEDEPIRGDLAAFDCRNNRLCRLGLIADGFDRAVADAVARHGADRVGIFIGTSTSGIEATERAYQRLDPVSGRLPADFDYEHTHNVFSVAAFTRAWLGLSGPASAISTACSSSAKVFATAYRHIRAGFCDAAVVGGCDSLCLTTLYGFRALELTSPDPCRPWDAERNGLSLGEAAGFALVEPAGPEDRGELALLGYGESSDAYHMTAAHPEGAGAALAMRDALDRAGLQATDVDYINLHGTATPSNDAAEDKAIVQVFGADTLCSSTKGWTGHTLGAAGIIEAAFSLLALRHGLVPANLNTSRIDPALVAKIACETETRPLDRVISNSFGFGGTNCSLVFGWLH